MQIKDSQKDLVVASRFLSQPITGVQRYGIELSYSLKKINQDINIKFVAPKKIIHKKIAEDLKVELFGINRNYLWDQLDLLYYLQKKGMPLLINFANTLPIFYKNKISVIHDIIYEKYPVSNSYKKYYQYIFPLMIKTSKHIITVSEFSKNELVKRYKIKERKISVVYDCVNEIFKPSKIEKTDKYILALSSVAYHKNFIGLLEAFQLLKNNNIKLYIVGGSNKKIFGEKSLDILRDIEKNPNVRYLGRVNDEKLVELYSNAQCFVYPSFYEGFGLPPLEAQACGCPIIISDIPVFKEIYGESAIYCNPHNAEDIANKIETVLEDKSLRENLSGLGIINSQKYRSEKSASTLISVIEKFL
jgi:glycosyltransferase involved in cell wall biosynthesis